MTAVQRRHALWHCVCGWCYADMSQKVVQSLIGQLLTDAKLRQQFVAAPLEMLLALRDSGVELTRTEIEGLVQIDRAFWLGAADRIHPNLQRWRPPSS